MIRHRIQVLPWLMASAVCVIAVFGQLGLSLQIPQAAQSAITVPVPPNQEVAVIVQDITPDIASAFGLKESHGAVVTALDAGTLRAGDVILSVNGQNISGRQSLEMALSAISPADTLIFHVSRNGTPHD